MELVKQISSLEKVRDKRNNDEYTEIVRKSLLRGERFSYQIAALNDASCGEEDYISGKIEVESPLGKYIRVFYVDNAVMDCPLTDINAMEEENFISKEPGLMPDILVPIEERNSLWEVRNNVSSLWIELNIPSDIKAGVYDINIKLRKISDGGISAEESYSFIKKMTIEVIDEKQADSELIYTRWFYADCICDYYNIEAYSEKHWELIEKYISAAVDCGVNMILVPVHTPPLDTAIGNTRTCVQLVDIKKDGDKYSFDFEKFNCFILICKKCGIKYFEIAHMFSQWGAKCAPNIMVEENGKKDYLFGWHVEAGSPLYISFLKQYISAICDALVYNKIEKNTYFHISDEPSLENIEKYKTASEIIRPLIGESKTFDALSSYEFYEKGLVECPVTCISSINNFLGKNVENQWLYYCCKPQSKFSNSIMAMPSARVRILGFLLYKYNIKGFLHWGFNFYNAECSKHRIDPYTTTSGEGAYPSGDPFIVYPAKNGAYSSIRAKVMCEAISDLALCRTLEKHIGREAVTELIDKYARIPLEFDSYPSGNEYIETLRDKMVEMIKGEL